ncbi:hypothetical protein EDB81DRAFT_861675 [Dactylonectria macrodidyma]|uniref:C2H2-type domain-containing protein n=1 Tax=Dactylonectria macrodidyma TaxID=307937 RepID=A0A9P9DK15_9HYPO|nr:hypothetical protein EDB81DRAFT_861675 [Dactylonectria macrodidyma]
MAVNDITCGSFVSLDDFTMSKIFMTGQAAGFANVPTWIQVDTARESNTSPDYNLFDEPEWLYGAGILNQPERYDRDAGQVAERGQDMQMNAKALLPDRRIKSEFPSFTRNHSMLIHNRTMDKRRARKFSCPDCTLTFGSQNDVDRHRSSIHDRRRPHVCRVPGCRRAGKGFSRKDNLMVHLRDVHGTSAMGQPRAEGIDGLEAKEFHDYVQGCPREELIQLALQQRARYEGERQRRQAAEEELVKLKKKCEERDDMWLNVLSKNY